MKIKENISPFKVIIIFLTLGFLGFFIIPKLAISLNPDKSLPYIKVNYSWASSPAYILEKEVTTVLEGGFNAIKGIHKLSSKSSKGSGYITIEFDKYTNIDNARFEVASIIRQIYSKLPEKVSYPTISVNQPDDNENKLAFLSYSINALQTPFAIQETVKNKLQPIIGGIQGVDKTQIYGATPKEYIINFDYALLQRISINKNDIITALQQKFRKERLGTVFYNKEYITLEVNSSNITNWHIPIKKIGSRIIYLDNISTIKKMEQETQTYYRVNGKNAITLAIYAKKNTNTIVLAKKVNYELNEILKHLPNDYSIIESYNSTNYLKKELNKIYERAIYTIIIIMFFILIISRNIYYLFITIITIIVNLGIAFLMYYMFNVEIQLFSLAGITISLGLMVDNSIVMIDHIKKQGNKNVFIPILASTLTTISALSVIFFLDDKYKDYLTDFAFVIIINLSVSLLVALFLIPALLDKISLKETPRKKWVIKIQECFYKNYNRLLKFLLRFKKLAIIFILLVFGIPFFMLPQKLENDNTFLEKAYNSTVGNEWYSENLRPYIDRYLGGSFRLFNYYVFENASYGINEETKLLVVASMEKGSTVHQMNEAFLNIENYLQTFIEIKQYTSKIYSSQYARIEISFNDQYEALSFPFILKAKLVQKALDLGGMDWNVYGVGNGFSNVSKSNEPTNFTIKAKGYNYDELNRLADTLKVELEKHPRVQNVIVKENSLGLRKYSYEYLFDLDKELLALKNSNPSILFKELKLLTLSKETDVFLKVQGKFTPIRLESNNSKLFDLWNIKHTPLGSFQRPIVLNSIATISKKREEESVFKENQEYIRFVKYNYTSSEKFGSIYLNETLKKMKTKLPLGYQFRHTENSMFLNDDRNNNYSLLLLLILGVIYFICAILFESLKQPFIILSVIPISFIGVFLTFYIFNFNFDQGGLASFILLSGITVNASIFIINGFNKLKKEQPNANYLDLFIIAFNQKIFPIALSISSTILGFIPFVKDGQNEVFFFALGVGTIGGLLFSLIGILIYLPLFTLRKS